jgi:hypothetical protein
VPSRDPALCHGSARNWHSSVLIWRDDYSSSLKFFSRSGASPHQN